MQQTKIKEASKKIHQIQVDLWEVEKLFEQGSTERAMILAVRMNLGNIDSILQQKSTK